jgi:putative endonuclease
VAAAWYVYVARCADDTLYCGIARDVARRIAAHDAGAGARYTRGRGPLRVELVRRCADHGRALRLERAIKQLARADKEALIAAPRRLAALARAVARRRAVTLPARGSARAAGSGG